VLKQKLNLENYVGKYVVIRTSHSGATARKTLWEPMTRPINNYMDAYHEKKFHEAEHPKDQFVIVAFPT